MIDACVEGNDACIVERSEVNCNDFLGLGRYNSLKKES